MVMIAVRIRESGKLWAGLTSTSYPNHQLNAVAD